MPTGSARTLGRQGWCKGASRGGGGIGRGVSLARRRSLFPQPGEGDEADAGDRQTCGGGGRGGGELVLALPLSAKSPWAEPQALPCLKPKHPELQAHTLSRRILDGQDPHAAWRL